jgi:hypothetical protein
LAETDHRLEPRTSEENVHARSSASNPVLSSPKSLEEIKPFPTARPKSLPNKQQKQYQSGVLTDIP